MRVSKNMKGAVAIEGSDTITKGAVTSGIGEAIAKKYREKARKTFLTRRKK